MNKIWIIVMILMVFKTLSINAQEKTLIEIDDHKISVDEFLHIYKKNNTDKDAMSLKAMNDYMDLFINFKLKVIEAENLGLDTTSSFISELEGYRKQLAQPYLSDKKVEEELIEEAYNRMLYDVEVSHILILSNQNATPDDTLKAWDKINMVYKRLSDGDDFKIVAQQMSEDESAKFNNGSLGWRTAFGLVYPFETAMYNTEVGEYSKPFRTRYGYHILKVTDKRPAKGRYKVAHIMITLPRQITEEQRKMADDRLDEVMGKLEMGKSFEDMAAEYSEDRRSAKSGGVIGWVNVGGKMIQKFENAVFELDSIGQISEPLKTSYGYHIIKLLEKEDIKSFESLQSMLKSKISNSARASKSRKTVIARLMKEYNAVIHKEAIQPYYSIVTDSIFVGTWNPENANSLDAPLFEFADVKYTQKDFTEFLISRNRKQQSQNIRMFIDLSFENFIDKKVIEYEQALLESKYPAFYYLMKEYHDGILLFELTDQKVWSKAIIDTTGLEAFYERNKENYIWDVRYEIVTIKCTSQKIGENLVKKVTKPREWTWVENKFNSKDTTVVLVEQKKYIIGDDFAADKIIKQSGVSPNGKSYKAMGPDKDDMIVTVQLIPKCNKTLDEAKGIVTADYQNELEKQWIENLRKKYSITIHKDVLESISE